MTTYIVEFNKIWNEFKIITNLLNKYYTKGLILWNKWNKMFVAVKKFREGFKWQASL